MFRSILFVFGSIIITSILLQRLSHLHLDDHSKINYGVGKGALTQFPTRDELIDNIKKKFETGFIYDVLVIGLGATGSGVALDAQTRNLSIIAVEQFDFASGTSSRSTKLLHGGVRYLKKAMLQPTTSYSQWKLVREALHERWVMFQQNAHLTNSLRIIAPVYNWKELVFTFIQMKLYDWISYPHIHSSYYISKNELKSMYPTLQIDDSKDSKESPIGAVAYYDGQFDDSRFNLAIVQTAIKKGADILNYAKVIEITHDINTGIANGAIVFDSNTNKTFNIRAKQIINAAGAFSDEVRKMDSQSAVEMMTTACGAHIVLDRKYIGSGENGLLITKTSDKRVLFVLPWQGKTLVGTTDSKCSVTDNPRASETEIQYLLNHINQYFNENNKVTRKDVLSSWSGIRPLKKASDDRETAAISREHAILTAKDTKIKSIIGGKWTTYRKMSAEVVDAIIKDGNFTHATPIVTESISLHGNDEYNPKFVESLKKDFEIENDIAFHINEAYGDQSYYVLELGKKTNSLHRLVSKSSNENERIYPYLEAEVIYAIRNEYALHPIDFLERRIRLSMIDSQVAQEALTKVAKLFANELNWSQDKLDKELTIAKESLQISLEAKKQVREN